MKADVKKVATVAMNAGKTLENISVIKGLNEDKIRAKTCSSIGPDNVVIQCNWLLIGYNALNLKSFNYVWRSCPSINGGGPCKLNSSK